MGKEIITQLKEQKKKGKPGPFKLHKVARKPRKGGDSDSEDDRKFSLITAQLAWERDIDLNKGQAFIKDPGVIENRNSKQAGIGNSVVGNGIQDQKSPTEEHSHLPNGNASSSRLVKRIIKKPNGTPKSSQKVQKPFTINRVTPLPFYRSDDDPVDPVLDEAVENDDEGLVQTNRTSYSDLYSSVQSTRKSVDKVDTSFIVKTDNTFVSEITKKPSGDSVGIGNNLDVEASPHRAPSADSKAIDQWVDEIMEDSREPSPAKSDSTGSPSRHKSKKRKKEKKERDKSGKEKKGRKDSEKGKSGEKKIRKRGSKTPTEEFLISDSDVDESIV